MGELQQCTQRPTQQIGEHQHHTKQLETNLKLQENHIAEMTAELDSRRASASRYSRTARRRAGRGAMRW